MKYLLLLLLFTASIYAASRVETTNKCIDGRLFIQTVVLQQELSKAMVSRWEPVSASLVQVFSQWGSTIAVTDCKTHDVKLR